LASFYGCLHVIILNVSSFFYYALPRDTTALVSRRDGQARRLEFTRVRLKH